MSTVRRDPTRTAGLRRSYGAELRRRLERLKHLIWQTVVMHDALYLDTRHDLRVLGRKGPGKKYEWPIDLDGKTTAFIEWLQDVVDDDVLGIEVSEGNRVVARSAWQNLYVRSAYSRAIEAATQALQRSGLDVGATGLEAVFGAAIHADTLAMLYTRNFRLLSGITDAMAAGISRELTMGLAQGLGAREVAALLNKQVEGIGIRRALVLARTEMVHAYSEASLNRYQEFGIKGVTAMVEFSTSGDDKVCDDCAHLEKRGFTIVDARGVIPVHPNCRCAWLPVV